MSGDASPGGAQAVNSAQYGCSCSDVVVLCPRLVSMSGSNVQVNMSGSNVQMNLSGSDVQVNISSSDTQVNMSGSDVQVSMVR